MKLSLIGSWIQAEFRIKARKKSADLDTRTGSLYVHYRNFNLVHNEPFMMGKAQHIGCANDERVNSLNSYFLWFAGLSNRQLNLKRVQFRYLDLLCHSA